MKALYDKLFTDYGGQIGYAPAIVTVVVCCALCFAVVYGGVSIGKAVYAKQAAIVVIHDA